ncbi:MAG: hypothetical protein Q8R88_05145, partial [Desulfoprunum sp.]|nr:hypothetical protein [Desulfoprunum sp.]
SIAKLTEKDKKQARQLRLPFPLPNRKECTIHGPKRLNHHETVPIIERSTILNPTFNTTPLSS